MSEAKEGIEHTVSAEERNYIIDNYKRGFYAIGLLERCRKEGKTLEEVRDEAVKEAPESPDETDNWGEAYEFLDENRERFGLERQNPDQGK